MRRRLRDERKGAGLTQAQLAHLVGLSQQTMSKHERGIATPQRMKTIRRYEEVLNVSGVDLFPDIFEQ